MEKENITFYIVDVFAESKYTGNQLAVFRNVSRLSAEEMQNIARETNYSETTFIIREDDEGDGFPVRIFTPSEEIPFAGHPTLGTAFIIQQEIIKSQVSELTLNLKIGKIPVFFTYKNAVPDLLWMKQNSPVSGKRLNYEEIIPLLNLNPEDIDNNFPVEEISTGLPALIVPLKNLDALKRCRVNKDKYFQLIKKINARTVLVFSDQSYDERGDISVRVFADYYGVPEDPATGSANGSLAGYLLKHNYFQKDSLNLKVQQGYEINRPSLLYLKAEKTRETINVFVGGRVVLVARGLFV